jgi:replication factor C subunit 3/5
MSAQSLSKVMEAVRSRCLCLRVAAPKHEEITKVLLSVAKKEGFGLPQPLAEDIARKSSRNLRRAILMLEATKVAGYPFQPNQQVQLPDWEMFIQHIGKLIMEQQSPQQCVVSIFHLC